MNNAAKILPSIVFSSFFVVGHTSAQTVLKGTWAKENVTVSGGKTQAETKRDSFKYKTILKSKSAKIKKYRASISSAFLQLNTKARVDSTIESPDCATSSGQYIVFSVDKR